MEVHKRRLVSLLQVLNNQLGVIRGPPDSGVYQAEQLLALSGGSNVGHVLFKQEQTYCNGYTFCYG